MSGIGEAAAVYGLITGTIEIVKTAVEIYDAVKDKAGLPRRLRIVAEKLPSIEQLLVSTAQQEQALPASTWVVAKQNVERCRNSCEGIKDIFEKAFPPQANVTHRVWTGAEVILSSKGKKAEALLQEVYDELLVLKSHHIIANTELLAQVKEGVDEIRSEESGRYVHYGSGSLGVNIGSGTQNFNSGSGQQFNNPQIGTFNSAGTT
ncbi:hypothetical protein LTS10_010472 [Elasticomyces elasticus]|nr:hypothetical protein LTS10_010472 [Elasticomyces elasticus]